MQNFNPRRFARWFIACGVLLYTWYSVAHADTVAPSQNTVGMQYTKLVLNKIRQRWIATLISHDKQIVVPATLHVHFVLTRNRQVHDIHVTAEKSTNLVNQLTAQGVMETKYPPFPQGIKTINDSLKFVVEFKVD